MILSSIPLPLPPWWPVHLEDELAVAPQRKHGPGRPQVDEGRRVVVDVVEDEGVVEDDDGPSQGTHSEHAGQQPEPWEAAGEGATVPGAGDHLHEQQRAREEEHEVADPAEVKKVPHDVHPRCEAPLQGLDHTVPNDEKPLRRIHFFGIKVGGERREGGEAEQGTWFQDTVEGDAAAKQTTRQVTYPKGMAHGAEEEGRGKQVDDPDSEGEGRQPRVPELLRVALQLPQRQQDGRRCSAASARAQANTGPNSVNGGGMKRARMKQREKERERERVSQRGRRGCCCFGWGRERRHTTPRRGLAQKRHGPNDRILREWWWWWLLWRLLSRLG